MSPSPARIPRLLCLSPLLALCLAACDRGGTGAADTAPAGSAPAASTAAAASASASGEPESASAAAPVAATAFDPASVPESAASLPPFPFFAAPEGLASTLAEKDRAIAFDRAHMIAGDRVVAVEGRIAIDRFQLANPDQREYSAIEFQRNYENAIRDLGGRRISTVQHTDGVNKAFGGREAVDRHYHGVCASDGCENHTYLVRQGGREYWIQVSTGAIPLHGQVVVLEREGMRQSLGFLDAPAMKKAIDADGRVALYVNFDVDQATLRPDAQPTIAEIGKLLAGDAALNLSIEGHTDDTGTPARNRELSTARARSVLGALVGVGVDPARLRSRGLGQDKPLADNGSEDGRAKNRRVELVKL